MNYIDYIIIFFLIIGFVLGFKDGLIRKLIGLVGFVLAIILAVKFSDKLGQYFVSFFNNELYLSTILAGVIIFFGTVLIFAVIKRIVHPIDKLNKFLNQLLGGLAGLLQIVILISGVLLFLNALKIPSKESKNNSLLYNSVYQIIPQSISLILSDQTKTKDYIKEFIKSGKEIDIDKSILDSLFQKPDSTLLEPFIKDSTDTNE